MTIYITSDYGIIGGNIAICWRNNAGSFFVYMGKSCVWVTSKALYWDLPSHKGKLNFDYIDIIFDFIPIDILFRKELTLLVKPFTMAKARRYGYYFRMEWLYWSLEWKFYLP